MSALPPLPLPLASALLRGIAWTRSTRRTACGASVGVMRGMAAYAQGSEGGGGVLWSFLFFGDGGVGLFVALSCFLFAVAVPLF